jgi:uncharacterized protein
MAQPDRPAATVVDRLDVEALPQGQVSRLALALVDDELGSPLHLPVLVARGATAGPLFGITCALHGDEINGLAVIHRLVEWLDVSALHGTVVAVMVVNVPGYRLSMRTLPDGSDLNLLMPGRADGNVANVYAYRFLNGVVRPLDYLVDLHTASRGRANSLYVRADMSDAVTAEMARLQRPQIILHNPPSDYTLRGAAAELGVPAITVEIGNPNRFQPKYIERSLAGLKAVLAMAGMVSWRAPRASDAPVLCRRSFWMYTDAGGLLEVLPRVTERVAQGEVVARLRNVYGDRVREYQAPEAGVVIGKSVSPVGPTGARILHLGLVAETEEELFARGEA